MNNPLYPDRKIYCTLRGEIQIAEVFDKDFKVIYRGQKYLQKNHDIGKIIFFHRQHKRFRNELYKFEEYLYFYPEWVNKNKEYKHKLEMGILKNDQENDIERIKNEIKIDKEKILQRRQDTEKAKKKIMQDAERAGLSSIPSKYKVNSNVFEEEIEYLNLVIDFIDNQIDKLSTEAIEHSKNRRITWSPSQEDIGNIQTYLALERYARSRAENLSNSKSSPYFARMDFKQSDSSSVLKMYIGKMSISDSNNVNNLVHDWRSPVGQRYYLKNELTFSYNEHKYDLLLRRALNIKNSTLVKYKDEYNCVEKSFEGGVSDPYLVEILKEKRGEGRFTDIIRTIQSNQNNIIREDKDENIIVQGCAGSGKTMILLHRLSYLMYNNSDINPDTTKIITPNTIFDSHINELAVELELNKIERYTIDEYFLDKLDEYKIKLDPKELKNLSDSGNLKNEEFCAYVYSTEFRQRLEKACYNWLTKITDQATNVHLFDLASSLGISFDDGKTNEDKINHLSYLSKRIIEENNHKNLKYSECKSKVEKYEEMKVEIQKSIDNISIEIAELKRKIIPKDRNIKEIKNAISKLEEEKTKNNEKIQSCENEKKALNKAIYVKQESLKSQRESELQKLSNCSIFSFAKKRIIRKKIGDIESGITKLEDPNCELALEINEKRRVLNNRLDKLNRSISFLNEKLKLEKYNLQNINEQQDIDIKNKKRLEELSASAKELETIFEEKQKRLISLKDKISQYRNKGNELEKVILSDTETLNIQRFNQRLPQSMEFIKKQIYYPLRTEVINEFNLSISSNLYNFDLYCLLELAYLHSGTLNKKDQYIYIDEGQDISLNEYKLIKSINGDLITFNVFGDSNQLIRNWRGIDTWESLSSVFENKYFELNENYRNTVEITEYCNNVFEFNSIPIGVSGDKVQEFSLFKENIDELTLMLKEEGVRKAIIIKDEETFSEEELVYLLPEEKINFIFSSKQKISYDKINVFTVEMSKGLEFDNVIVFTKAMTMNEKYISLTRTLDKLIVVHSIKANNNSHNNVLGDGYLEKIIFDDFGAEYETDYRAVANNLNNGQSELKRYLGTYFPRSVVESHSIFCELFREVHIKQNFTGKTEIRVLDIGSGTGGNLIGLMGAIDKFWSLKNKKLHVTSIDGNNIALGYQNSIISKTFKQKNIVLNQKQMIFDNKSDFAHKLKNYLDEIKAKFDIIISFKFVSELYNENLRKNKGMYGEFLKLVNECLAEDGLAVINDVTSLPVSGYNNYEYLPKLMNNEMIRYLKQGHSNLSIILPLSCAVWYKNCLSFRDCFQQKVFKVSHRFNKEDISKVTFKVFTTTSLANKILRNIKPEDCYRVAPRKYCCRGYYDYGKDKSPNGLEIDAFSFNEEKVSEFV